MTDSGDWILKILSGPHQGAEVPIAPGRIVVGSHRDCDLVLHDVLAAPQHFVLSFEKGVLTVEPLDGPIFCNGRRVERTSPVPEFGFVTAGTTHVVIGPAAARWPLLSLTDVPELEKEAVTAARSDGNTLAEASPLPSPGKKNLKPSPEQRRRALWTAGAGGVLLLVWLILWLTWVPHPIQAPRNNVRERAEQVLRDSPNAKSITLEEQDGRLVATGYLESDAAQREVTAALRAAAPEVTLRIWSLPQLVDTARSFLNERVMNLDLSVSGNGELTIRGTVRSGDEWAPTRQLLLSEIPGLRLVRDEVRFMDPPASSSINVASARPSAVPSTVSGVENLSIVAIQSLANGQGWLRLSNGAVFFRGAQLGDGVSVISIQPGWATVEKGGTLFTLRVGVKVAAALNTPPLASEDHGTWSAATPQVVAEKTDPPNR